MNNDKKDLKNTENELGRKSAAPVVCFPIGMHTYMYAYTHVYVYVHRYTYIHVRIYACINILI